MNLMNQLMFCILFCISTVFGGIDFFRSRTPDDPSTGKDPQGGDQYDLPYLINNDNKVDFHINITGYDPSQENMGQNFSRCFHDDDWLRFGPKAQIWAGDRYGVNNCKIKFPPSTYSKFSMMGRAKVSDVEAGSRIQGNFWIVIPQFKWNIDCPACGGQCIFKIPVLEKIYNISMPACPFNFEFPGLPGWIPLDLLPEGLSIPAEITPIQGPIRLVNPDGSTSFEMSIKFRIHSHSAPPIPGIDPVLDNPNTVPPKTFEDVMSEQQSLPSILQLFEVDMDARRNLAEDSVFLPQMTSLLQATTWISHGIDTLFEIGSIMKAHLEDGL